MDWVDISLKTNHSQISSAELETIRRVRRVSAIFRVTFSIVLLLIGLPGNVLSIAVFYRMLKRRNRLYVYFISLCVTNLLTLSVAMPLQIHKGLTGLDLANENTYFCAFIKWITAFNIALTAWHLVTITLCVLLYLITSTRCCYTHTNPTIVIFSFSVTIGAVLGGIVCMAVVNRKVARVDSCYIQNNFWSVLILVIYSILPAIILSVLTLVLLVFHFRKKEKMAREQNKQPTKVSRHMITLVIVSSVHFVFSIIPLLMGNLMGAAVFKYHHPVERAKAELTSSITVQIVYLSNATNFFLYCIFGFRFRAQLLKLKSQSCSCRHSSDVGTAVGSMKHEVSEFTSFLSVPLEVKGGEDQDSEEVDVDGSKVSTWTQGSARRIGEGQSPDLSDFQLVKRAKSSSIN